MAESSLNLHLKIEWVGSKKQHDFEGLSAFSKAINRQKDNKNVAQLSQQCFCPRVLISSRLIAVVLVIVRFLSWPWFSQSLTLILVLGILTLSYRNFLVAIMKRAIISSVDIFNVEN